jgi:Zn-dependent protease
MPNTDFRVALLSFFGFLIALTMHEAAHAFMARALGDRSPTTQERATINPIPHIDLFGTILFPLMMLVMPMSIPIIFGWAKRYEFTASYFRKVKRDLNLVAIAGPGMNFLIAALCGLGMRLMESQAGLFTLSRINVSQAPLEALLGYTALSNIVIGILNFLPFPGSDGWRLVVNNVNYSIAQRLEQSSMFISIAMLLLLFSGVLNPVIVGSIFLFQVVFGLG